MLSNLSVPSFAKVGRGERDGGWDGNDELGKELKIQINGLDPNLMKKPRSMYKTRIKREWI